MLKAKALSIRQPWAWLIVRPDLVGTEREHAVLTGIVKTVENRSWPTKFRGGFLVHAAQGMTRDEFGSAMAFATAAMAGKSFADPRYPGGRHPLLPAQGRPAMADEMHRGGIVGYAEVIDCMCTERHEDQPLAKRSPWFMGEYGFQLANVHPLSFLPMTGRLSFFEVEVPDNYIPDHLVGRLAP